jgi:hypothetical protein
MVMGLIPLRYSGESGGVTRTGLRQKGETRRAVNEQQATESMRHGRSLLGQFEFRSCEEHRGRRLRGHSRRPPSASPILHLVHHELTIFRDLPVIVLLDAR